MNHSSRLNFKTPTIMAIMQDRAEIFANVIATEPIMIP